MKKFLVTLAMIGVSAPALAETVKDYNKTVVNRVPYSVEVCTDQVVGGDKTGDALKGAIIGGIIGGVLGNTIVKGGGKSTATGAGAVAGAIIGGNHGNKQSEIIGYREQQVCKDVTTYDESSHTVYGHSTITFTYEGRTYSLNFQK